MNSRPTLSPSDRIFVLVSSKDCSAVFGRRAATPGFGGGRAPSFHFGQGSAASEAPDASPPAPWSYLPYYVGEAEKARVQVPYVVSLSALCVYAAPTIISIRLGTDPDAAFWIGRVGLVACLVPVFLALMHLVHSAELARGRARRSTVSITAIVPGVVLAVTGIVYSAESAFLQSHLMSDDCIARSSQPLSEKPRLQAAYALGLRAYAACQERHYDDNGREMLPRSPHPTLQQCTQWRTADDSLVLGEDLVTWRGYVDEQTVAEWFLGSLGFDLVSKNYWADRPQREHTYYWREWDYLAQVEAGVRWAS
ncbi:unnamed protein product [Prorocentrum cordatum]|uniref:Uncharacterized protein n=1 Tax=Prorocentrum cordatum TaxID=2364126 RepID=A0ABN9UT56_9DINO|nr:unnamed protein product [Polarella glacialis]